MTLTIQEIMNLIEYRLDSQIEVSELAQKSGYSLFYFYRLFQKEVGMPVMQYITRRKLLACLVAISKGESITDAGLKYGFSTHSGFFKAFIKTYGISPSEYLSKMPIPSQYRIQLKKEKYKFMTINQIRKILVHWPIVIESLIPVYQPNTLVLSDHVWNINSTYYLKLFDTLKAVEKELHITRSIQDQKVLLPTLSGKEYIEVKGNYFILFHDVEGTPINSENCLEQHTNRRYIGEVIGQLALELETIKGQFSENNLLEDLNTWALPEASNILNLSSSWKDHFQHKITYLFPKLPRQLIHRDLNSGNLLLAENRFTAIDFELAEVNYRIYDPCYFLTSVLSEQIESEQFNYDGWLKLVKEVLIGYDQVVHLTDYEKEALPYILLSNQLICISYFAQYDKYAQFLEITKKMTMMLLSTFDELQKIARMLKN